MLRNQIFIVHGGMTFKNKKDYVRFLKTRKVSLQKRIRWTGDYLDKKLGRKFEIIRPRMPLQDDAKYKDWKIHFERFIPLLKNNIILIGESLGGIFLARYLSENKFPKKLAAVFLVCPPFNDSLFEEDLRGGFRLRSDLSMLDKSTKRLFLLFSANDDVIPIAHAEKYRKKLKNAKIIIYKNKNGHFNIATFPEIVRIISRC